jgi:hypothetical protein
LGDNVTASGSFAVVLGKNAKTTIASTIELGHWTNATTRASSIRVHPNNQVAHSIVDSVTAPTDGGAIAGSEADATLARGMFTIQKNGTAVSLYYNDGGAIQSLSLGTLA